MKDKGTLRFIAGALWGGLILLLIFTARVRWEQKQVISSRAIDTVDIGTTANDGTGDPLRTAFIKVNRIAILLDSLGVDGLVAQDITNLQNLVSSLSAKLDAALFELDSLTVSGTEATVWMGADTGYVYTPVSMRDDATTIFPTIQSAAGDTSNYATPDKIGDLYINTATGKVYVSVAAARGGWRILNYILPLFFIVSYRRRRRK